MTKRMHLAFYSMMFTLKYENFSAVEGASNVSSEGKPTFEIEIEGALEVTNQLHLKIHMVVHCLVQNAVSVDVSLGGAIKVSPLNLKFSSLYVL